MYWVTVLFLMFGAGAENLELVTKNGSVSFTLDQLREKLTPRTVEVTDVLFKRPKSYDAFALEDVLRLAGANEAQEIVFTAKDGYSPNVSLENVKAHKAFLTFQEHGRKEDFELVPQGKAMLSPGPYYLVWQEGLALAEKVPWPYQIVKIEFVDFRQKYAAAYPEGGPAAARKGFTIFKEQCIRCHSINLLGGEIGPELNTPKSVTEYWRRDVLPRFIKQASQYRAKSKMPDFTHLSDADVAHVIAYLQFMKTRKVR